MTPVVPAAALPGQPSRARTMLAGAALTVLVLAAVAWGLNSAGVLRLGGGGSSGDSLRQAGEGQGGNSLMAPGGGGSGSMLEAQGTSDSGAMLPSQAERARMPQDVYDWLEHLRRTEVKKEDIRSQQLRLATSVLFSLYQQFAGAGELQNLNMEGTQTENPLDIARKEASSLKQAWLILKDEYLTKEPPAICKDLALKYQEALEEVSGEIGDFDGILAGDPAAAYQFLKGIQGKSVDTIDKPLEQCDGFLAELCAHFGVRKWFSIKSDRGDVPMLKLGGLGP